MEVGNSWQNWALAALTGILMSGGVVGAIGHSKYEALEAKYDKELIALEEKFDAEILKIEIRNDKDYDVIMDIALAVARIEIMVEAMQ